ncbi:MAG: tetratricopeptide repeat protein, partial [Chloroflexota bacterium]
KDYQGAINDCNQAIKITPEYADAYYNRGVARRKLKDYKRAINDFIIAATLYKKKGDKASYQGILKDHNENMLKRTLK